MKVNDLDENWATGLAKGAWQGIKKGASYLTKPAGLYKTDADAAAAAIAAKKVDKATAALDKTKSAISGAQSQQAVDKLSTTLAAQKDKLSAAQELAKSAPQRQFTTGQKIARPASIATASGVTGAVVNKALSGGSKEVAPASAAAPVADNPAGVNQANVPSDAPAPFGTGKTPQVDPNDDIPLPPGDDTKEGIEESIADILKLSGQKAITSRDNVTGIIKPKEIVALNESKKLDECGMMPSAPNTTASLSINATAGSGEEVANMLAAIMNLAGVKPVTSDMLGTTDQPPMPIVKAIDIVSRDMPDSMNDAGEEHEETLSGMEEEYANTPEDPTDTPDFDMNKMAYQPNDAEPGDRMDGTMPRGVPTEENLKMAFEAFKNGQ